MTGPPEGENYLGHPMEPVFSLGHWLIRSTAIVRKHRKDRFQVLLLFPPSGFSGDARLGVIDGKRRAEYSAAWKDGRSFQAASELRAQLDHLFAGLLPEGEGPPDKSPARWPAIFAAGLDPARASRAAKADLLLEVTADQTESGEPPSPLSGRIAFPQASEGTTIYMAPILPLPVSAAAAPPGSVPEKSYADLLSSALRAAERDRTVRLALPETWAPTILDRGLEPRIRALAATGRLELLRTGEQSQVSTTLLDLPFPIRIGLLNPQDRIAPTRGDLRALLLWHPWKPSNESVNEGLSMESADDGPHSGTQGLTSGKVGRLSTEEMDLLVHAIGPYAQINPLEKGFEPYAVALFDRVLADAAAHIVRVRSTSQPAPVCGFFPLFLSCPDAWKRLGQAVRRWNRGHSSPLLLLTTPSDYFSTLEELHARGALQRRR